jgi:membrane protease subunit HflK
VFQAYSQAQDVTVRRLYLETMEEILRRNNMILVDDRLQGLVPLLPLDGNRGGAAPTPRPAVPPAAVVAPTMSAPARPVGQGLPR